MGWEAFRGPRDGARQVARDGGRSARPGLDAGPGVRPVGAAGDGANPRRQQDTRRREHHRREVDHRVHGDRDQGSVV
jgi:hypothetical protein